jgi:hypothetical protein
VRVKVFRLRSTFLPLHSLEFVDVTQLLATIGPASTCA